MTTSLPTAQQAALGHYTGRYGNPANEADEDEVIALTGFVSARDADVRADALQWVLTCLDRLPNHERTHHHAKQMVLTMLPRRHPEHAAECAVNQFGPGTRVCSCDRPLAAEPARLDADGTAQPKTEIRGARVEPNRCVPTPISWREAGTVVPLDGSDPPKAPSELAALTISPDSCAHPNAIVVAKAYLELRRVAQVVCVRQPAVHSTTQEEANEWAALYEAASLPLPSEGVRYTGQPRAPEPVVIAYGDVAALGIPLSPLREAELRRDERALAVGDIVALPFLTMTQKEKILERWPVEAPPWPPAYVALCARVEQLEVQLAGCGVAALGWSRGEQEAKPGDYGYSASYGDVVKIRRELEKLARWIENLHRLVHGPNAHEECDPIYLKTPGGRASCASWKAHMVVRRLSELEQASPDDIRAKGWRVQRHWEGTVDGAPIVRWEFRRYIPGEVAPQLADGEGSSDAEALDQVRAKIAEMEKVQCR